MKTFRFLGLNWTFQHNIIYYEDVLIEWNFTFLPMIQLCRNTEHKKTYLVFSWLIFTLQIDKDETV